MKINKAAIIGFGAIGCVYGKKLYKLMGNNFAVVAGGKRAERLRQNGETINGEKIMPFVVEPDGRQILLFFRLKIISLTAPLTTLKIW